MHRLLTPPIPLSTRQRQTVWVTAAVVAVTRLFALSRTLWDWDEAQFCLALREYDVPTHHPHPPGFPLFVAAANAVRLIVSSDFRSLQIVTVVGACALFPLAFFLARELRFPFSTAWGAAVLFVFLPNVWFYGGTAFSDIAGLALILAAVLFLLRGCHDRRAYLTGALLLGAAAGVRPQAVLFGCAPFLIATWCRRYEWRRIVAASLIAAAVVGVSYAGAALASSSFAGYRASLEGVREWVRTVDAFTNPARQPLSTLVDDFLIAPLHGNDIALVVSALAVIAIIESVIRRRIGVWIAVATFLPFAFFAWLMLDVNSINRYSTSYVFLHALLAAHGAFVVTSLLPRRAAAAHIVLVLIIAAIYVWWTAPALVEVRTTASPPVAAMQWLREHAAERTVWVHGSLSPWSQYFLHGYETRYLLDEGELIEAGADAGAYYVTEGLVAEGADAAIHFTRPRERVWRIARRRYFETSIVPVATIWDFGDGWYDRESAGEASWRWMAGESSALLPPVEGDTARLTMTLVAASPLSPEIEVRVNGRTIDRFLCTPDGVTKSWIVPVRPDEPTQLELVSSETMNPAEQGIAPDARTLSVMLRGYAWYPVRSESTRTRATRIGHVRGRTRSSAASTFSPASHLSSAASIASSGSRESPHR